MKDVAIILLIVANIGQMIYGAWRTWQLVDERDEAREYAERFQDLLRKRPVRVRTIIYKCGEKIDERLSA